MLVWCQAKHGFPTQQIDGTATTWIGVSRPSAVCVHRLTLWLSKSQRQNGFS